ncbi:hypothetical protein [Lactiplantibacillus xiangfangensis]|uniref:hypothetical protein n=1 Tax=Lactiplantibacillus xiangfangensis TaxID=942150 RepID=UPI00384A7A21
MATKIQYNHVVEVAVDNGSKKLIIENTNNKLHLAEIHFSLPFSDDPVPNVCTVTIYNLSKVTRAVFKKKAHVSIQAGYKDDVGLLTEGNINKIQPLQWSGVDSAFTFTFIEGTDYSKKKDVSMTFKKGASALTIIKGIAKKAGIPLSSIKLQIPKKYSNGYTADGQPLELIEEIAKKCGSVVRIIRGKYKVVYDESVKDLTKIIRTRTKESRTARNKYLTSIKHRTESKKYINSSAGTIAKNRATYKRNLAAAKARLAKAKKIKTKKSRERSVKAAEKSIKLWQDKISVVGNLKSHANALASYKKRDREVTTAKEAWQAAESALAKAKKAQKAAGTSKKSTTKKAAEFLLSFKTGLTEEPAYSDDDDGERWSFTCLLQHRIATDSVIQVKSRSLNKKMIVESGEHSYDGSSFLTTGVLK